MSENARLFVAAQVPDTVHGAYAALREELARRVPTARWVRTEGVHLTFKFLGAVPRPRIPELGDGLAAAVSSAAPFRLTTGAIGTFGPPRRPRVLWLALEGDVPACTALASEVDRALVHLGFPPEGRPFHPHLTLARFATEGKPPGLPEDARTAAETALRGLEVPIAALVLFESFPGRGGSRYEARCACPLGGGRA